MNSYLSYQYLLLDEKCTPISTLNPMWDYSAGFNSNGICVARLAFQVAYSLASKQERLAFIDKDGHFLEPAKEMPEALKDYYEHRKDIMGFLPEDYIITDCTSFSNDLAGITPDNQNWFVIDKYLAIHGYGKKSIYQHINRFSNGLASVKKNGKWGFIDYQLNEVIPCQYDSCEAFAYPFIEIVYDLDSKRNIKNIKYLNRKHCVVWSHSFKQTVHNKYANKLHTEWGKWKFHDYQ